MAAKSVYERLGKSNLTGSDQTARRHVFKGATLPALTAFEYDTGYDSELWRQVAEYNGIDDLDAIDAGTVFTLPQPTPTT
jgi:nucleoid-associated protein YgaU